MRTRQGLVLAAAAAVISGFAVYTNAFGVRAFGNATVYTTAKNLVAAIILLTMLAVAPRGNRPRGSWPFGGWAFGMTKASRPSARQWAGLGVVAVIGGSVPFILFFRGLAMESASAAAFTQKTLVIWVALLAVPLLRERFTVWHAIAIGALVCGQAVLGGGISGLRFSVGEALVFAATLLWAAETILARRLLANLPPLAVATARMGGGVVILAGWTLATTPWSALTAIGWHQWSWALGTGLILAAYVAVWFAALARAGAIDVTAMLVPGAIITVLLQGAPLAWPGLVLVACGVAALLPAIAGRRVTLDAAR